MRDGKYGVPVGEYAAAYKPGSVADFEWTVSTNHKGFIEFYLCDVSGMPGQDISYKGFADSCHHLERVSHPSCEAGDDPECGPIDPKFPGRWVFPCDNGVNGKFGGPGGKMAYKLPNVEIKVGVLQVWWVVCALQCSFM
jgi:hypothetical protein